MTCKEKLKIEHPDRISKWADGGCIGCPRDYDYLDEPTYCNKVEGACRTCWNREIPETDKPHVTDNVNHPTHYETGKFECIDVMVETQGVDAVKNFCLCNEFKYIYRTRRKNGLEDVKKALWYLEKYVELEGKQYDN